jgi:site-specific DNA-adenine methylase
MRVINKEVKYDLNLMSERGTTISADGLPYLGSKKGLFEQILFAIEKDRGKLTGKAGIPFCGGGSDTIGFARNGYLVKSSDINIGAIDLLKRITRGDAQPMHFAKSFMSGRLFNLYKKENNWMGAFARAYYSYRSIGQTYAFGSNTELMKEHWILFDAVIWGAPEDIKAWNEIAKIKGYGQLPDGIPAVSWLKNTFGVVVMMFYSLRLDTFKLDNPNAICWETGDYEEHDWSDCDFLYCDIPYSGGAGTEYRESIGKVAGFDHDRFWKWAREMSKEKPVYVSEKNIPLADNRMKVLFETQLNVRLRADTGLKKCRKEYLIRI